MIGCLYWYTCCRNVIELLLDGMCVTVTDCFTSRSTIVICTASRLPERQNKLELHGITYEKKKYRTDKLGSPSGVQVSSKLYITPKRLALSNNREFAGPEICTRRRCSRGTIITGQSQDSSHIDGQPASGGSPKYPYPLRRVMTT